MSDKTRQRSKSPNYYKNNYKKDIRPESPDSSRVYSNKITTAKHCRRTTPIYQHFPNKADQQYFKTGKNLSDFVYIKKNIKSETVYDNIFKSYVKTNKTESKSSLPDKETVISKKTVSVSYASPHQENNNSSDKEDNEFFLLEEAKQDKIEPKKSTYIITEEERQKIETTLPPGETIIIPTLVRRRDARFSANKRQSTRKCYCKSNNFGNKINSTEGKVPSAINVRHAHILQDERGSYRTKRSKGIDSTGMKKKRRAGEKKVDERASYKSLTISKKMRIDREEYQKHFHLRIHGPSVLKGLKFDPVKIYWFGERGSGFRTKAEPQDFYKLRDELLDSGRLFEDPDFPPTDSSLYYSQRPDRRFEWKRPHEICDDPQLFVEGYSRFDVQQGELGDCWLLAAVANLTLYRRLFFQVVPDDQSFTDKYAGIFHFRFWQYGRWIDVVIDDLLPTYHGQLVFLHSTEDNEFWSALLEKAYAKLHGSYEALKGGSTCEAMEDFTGGVTEMYEMNASPPNLFKIVLKAFERSSLMGCSLEPDPNVLEAATSEGLIRGHAYSITRVKYVDIHTPNTVGKIPLLRLRNPWGNESEWNGPWSDKSPEWRFIPEAEKEELGLTFDDDGEFWMSFKDFQNQFDRLEICNLNPDSLTDEEVQEGNKKRWEVSFFEGEWVRGVTAGGCRNYIETFANNPQYRITLTEVDEGDDEGKCTLIVALMQKNRRSQRNMGIDILTIGFAIYYLPHPNRVPKPLNLEFFKYNASVARSPSFINLREVSCRFKLPPGTYCIVPSTFEPNEQGEFLLRIFSEHQNNMEENDAEIGYGDVDDRVKNIEPTPEENRENDQVYQFFLKLAGDDGEVDWMELKDILDYAMRQDTPMYKMETKGVEGGYPGQAQAPQDTTCCTQALVIGGAALCCFLCMQLCKQKDNQNQTQTNTFAPLATGCFAELCRGNLMNTTNNSNRNYNSVDTEIITTPPNPSGNYEMRHKPFSKDVCRSMVAMLDVDNSGKLGFEEFKSLWSDVRDWKNVFRLYDRDNSGTLDGAELRQALNSAGYSLNYHILNILMHRYGNKQGQLEFDDFIMCAVKLKTMIVKRGGISEEALIQEIQNEGQFEDRYF